MGLRPKICAGVIVLLTLTPSLPVLSAPSVEHGEVEHGTIVTQLPAPRSAFLPIDEGRLLALMNRERRARGMFPLFLNVSLRSAARAHARDMALWGYVGHTSRYGLSVRDRITKFVRPGPRIGENLAFVQTIEQGHMAFMGSSAHRRNMLDPAFRRVGIGVATMGGAGIMIAEDFTDFAGPRPQPTPHRAWPIHCDNSTSSASTAPVTGSRSARWNRHSRQRQDVPWTLSQTMWL